MKSIILLVSLSTLVFAAKKPIFKIDFESSTLGPYTDEIVKKEWGKVGHNALFDRARIVQEKNSSNKTLEIHYPAGAYQPDRSGGQFTCQIPPADELWLSYRLKFEKGFEFKLGGKLPGLTSAGAKYTGGKKPTAGDGWSARFMWGMDGKAVIYLYYVDMKETWGENILLDGIKFKPERWYKITEHVKINSPEKNDGVVEAWVDDIKVASRNNLRLRIGDKGRIDSFYFSTFHGGNTQDWSPTQDCYVMFDDFIIESERPASLSK